MTLGPVVAGTRLAEHKVVGPEDLAERSRSHRVHGAGLQIDKDSAGHVLATGRLIVVHIDALQLQVAVTVVGAGGIDAMLIGDDLPELQMRNGSKEFGISAIRTCRCCTAFLVNMSQQENRLLGGVF